MTAQSPRLRASIAVLAAGLLAACGSAAATPSAPGSPTATPGQTAIVTLPSATAVAPQSTGTTGLPILADGLSVAGTYEVPPPEGEWHACMEQAQVPACVEAPGSKTIRLTLTVPDGWDVTFGGTAMYPHAPASAGGVGLLIAPGGYLHTDPCLPVAHAVSEMRVDPTSVGSFVDALVAHPLLDVTAPTSISLGGFNGQYLELTAPADISACVRYRPWEPGIYAQGPSDLWRLWVIDVAGTRMTVQAEVLPGTPASDVTALETIVNSIRFIP